MDRKMGKRFVWIILFLLYFGISNAYGQETTVAESERGKQVTPRKVEVEIEKGGVLLPQGTMIIEPGFQYSHTSRARIAIRGFTIFQAIILGEIKSEDVEKDMLMPFINLRLGILDRLQGDLKIPWVYRRDKTAYKEDTSTIEKRSSSEDIGDIEGGLYFHILRDSKYFPDIVFNLRGKSRTGKDPYGLQTDESGHLTEYPTGSGHYSISGGFTVSKSSDPAVLFGSVNYFYNFARDAGGSYGNVKPGDSIEYGLGMAFALNEKLSTSLYYQQRFYFKTEQNDINVIGTDYNVANLYFGVNHLISDRISINFSVGVGLTDDSPDVTAEIRLPIKF